MSERIEATLRMLLDSGDITPMGARVLRQVTAADACQCSVCVGEGDNQADLWDGTPPLGGDDMDGK